MWLSTIWSCRAKCLIECDKSAKLSTTKLIRVTPQPNNGEEELIELRRRLHGSETELWFQFQKVNFYYSQENGTFGRRIYPIERPITEFTKSKGLCDQTQLSEAGRLYELNEMVMELPDFRTLFIERATAPFFVFQGSGLKTCTNNGPVFTHQLVQADSLCSILVHSFSLADPTSRQQHLSQPLQGFLKCFMQRYISFVWNEKFVRKDNIPGLPNTIGFGWQFHCY